MYSVKCTDFISTPVTIHPTNNIKLYSQFTNWVTGSVLGNMQPDLFRTARACEVRALYF